SSRRSEGGLGKRPGPETRWRECDDPTTISWPARRGRSMKASPPKKTLRPRRKTAALRDWLEPLEDPGLLSGASPTDMAGAIPLALGPPATVNGTVAPGAPLFYRITPDAGGLLTAQVRAVGATARLSLLDAQGQVLVQSDGQSRADTDPL